MLSDAWVLLPPQTTHQTSHGQLLDLITAPIGTVRLLHSFRLSC